MFDKIGDIFQMLKQDFSGKCKVLLLDYFQAVQVEQLEQRILQQESQISNMENRNFFSLHCVQMETQLIHANLESVYYALESMVKEEAKAHYEVSVIVR